VAAFRMAMFFVLVDTSGMYGTMPAFVPYCLSMDFTVDQASTLFSVQSLFLLVSNFVFPVIYISFMENSCFYNMSH
jgi:hypothetical protein